MNKVLILGGYGHFGARIAASLIKKNISVVLVGRDEKKAQALRNNLIKNAAKELVHIAVFDANKEFDKQLEQLKPLVVINTIGPFQTADYSIATSCIQHGVHYIDLADARDFVKNITCLDESAKKNNVLVVSGASTVPGLSSAVLEHYKNEFSTIDSLIYGISPAQKTERGLATTQSILSYLGKPLKPGTNDQELRYGWQNIYRQNYPEIGKRWMANCEIPDLDLFPEQYGLKSIQFSAGMENGLLHLGMWVMSWVVRLGVRLNLPKHAKPLLRFSHLFDYFGSSSGGMHMLIRGTDNQGNAKQVTWFIITKNGDGPQIPCIPAILLTQKLIHHNIQSIGAFPCVGMISLAEYMSELEEFSVKCNTEFSID